MSVKQLSNIIILSVLAGCSSTAINSQQAAVQFDARYDECEDLGIQNVVDLPESQWFDSLSFSDKKIVVGYLYNLNQRACTKEATEALRAALKRDPNAKVQASYQEFLAPISEGFGQRAIGLDVSKILEMQRQFDKPFNLRHILTTENLYPKRS